MPINAPRLRRGFAILTVLIFVVVVGFYSYARYRIRRAIHEIPAKLGVNIQQSTQGFTFSKSEGGRTLFSISAGKAVQYKQGERATLSDVRIIIYGSKNSNGTRGKDDDSDHYDQIFGKEFDYDPNSGDVTANGEVQIDLEAPGKPSQTMAPSQESPGTIHLRTTALTFNQKTGIAQTRQPVEFAFPQASGSAVGAQYDTKLMALSLLKEVKIMTSAPSGTKSGSSVPLNSATILAESAIIANQPRQALLTGVHMEQANHKFLADNVTIQLRPDNSVAAMQASGNVHASTSGKSANEIRADHADFTFGGGNALANLIMKGRVSLHEKGASPIEASAGRVVVNFAGKNQVQTVRASENVHYTQVSGVSSNTTSSSAAVQSTQLSSEALDLYFTAGNQLQRAETAGAAQLELNSGALTSAQLKRPPVHNVITAGKFHASFGPQNRLTSLFGSPNARIVSSTSGQPDRVSTSRDFTATFDPAHNGALLRLVQKGEVRYTEGQRSAFGDSFEYTPMDEMVTLKGEPRLQDKDSGLTITAQRIKLNRATQGAIAEGEVKTTVDSSKRKNTNGAMLTSRTGDPVHVTADQMSYAKATNTVRYTGHTRLWRGADVIQAPVLVFDQNNGTLLASGSESGSDSQPVKLSFAKADKSGKVVPVTVIGTRLTYSDKDREAKLDGPVNMKMPDATMSSMSVDVVLKAKNQSSSAATEGPSEIERVIARQNVLIEQKNPSRKAAGETLVYTAADEKFVLTGTATKPPSIFDAERGNVTGDSLTFYNHDDRVQVGGSDSSRTVTRTRVKSESKP